MSIIALASTSKMASRITALRNSAIVFAVCGLPRNQMERRPFPASIQKAMDQGTNLESHILNLLYDEHDFTFADGGFQKEVDLQVKDNIVVIGHIDKRVALITVL